jgi:hypothetical protein
MSVVSEKNSIDPYMVALPSAGVPVDVANRLYWARVVHTATANITKPLTVDDLAIECGVDRTAILQVLELPGFAQELAACQFSYGQLVAGQMLNLAVGMAFDEDLKIQDRQRAMRMVLEFSTAAAEQMKTVQAKGGAMAAKTVLDQLLMTTVQAKVKVLQ